MPFNGSGGFIALTAPDFPAVSGDIIYASRFNNVINDILTGLSTTIAKDGQSTPSANLPMGSFKHTGAGSATAAGQYLVYGQSAATAATFVATTAPGFTASGIAEGLRLKHDAGFLSGYDTAGVTRTGFLQFSAGSNVSLAADGLLPIIFVTNGVSRVLVNAAGVAPWLNDTYSSGTSLLRWSNTYSVLGNFSSTVTGIFYFASGQAEGLRVANDGGFLSIYNSANSVRSGYLQGFASGNVVLMNDSNNAVQLGTNSVIRTYTDASGMYPALNNAYICGASTARWSNVFSVLGNFSSTVTMGAGATIATSLTVGTTLGVTGAATLASAAISGAVTVGTTLGVTGITTAGTVNATSVAVSGNVGIGTTLGVTGITTATGGVAFANSNVAGNTLDWYEEGTFTPSLLFGGAAVGMTYTSRSGNFVRIGSLVFFRLAMVLSAKGSSTGTATIAGLPYASATTNARTEFVLDHQGTGNIGSYVIASLGTNSSTLATQQLAGNTTGGENETYYTNTTETYVCGVYQVTP